MKKLFILILLSSLMLHNCEEDDPEPDACVAQNFGLLCIENQYDETVSVEINNASSPNIAAGQTSCIKLQPGFYNVKAEEADAILLPDTWEFSVDISQCETIDRILSD